MLIPEFWAGREGTFRGPRGAVRLNRWGWSNVSREEAQAMADRRLAEAGQRLERGEAISRRERKRSYGAEGLPIREEIVSRQGNAVVTRNIYGALCLNVPDVMFVDVDRAESSGRVPVFAFFGALAAVSVLLRVTTGARWMLVLLCAVLIASLVAWLLNGTLARWRSRRWEASYLRRLDSFLAARPDWGLRVYRTPAGLRLLAIHREFDPGDASVQEAFSALGADPLYSQLCLRQQCFRARVSPKPWRIGMQDTRRIRRVWPVPDHELPRRQEWIAGYEALAEGYSSCEYLTTLGNKAVSNRVRDVQVLHDQLCRAESGLPIA